MERAKNCDVFRWSIILKENNRCIGQISCQNCYDDQGNVKSDNIRDVGWVIDSKYHGMGLGTEAAKEKLDYMFYEVNIDKIETCAAIENIASWKIMEKLGFRRINKNRMVRYNVIDNDIECYCYEITRDEYERN